MADRSESLERALAGVRIAIETEIRGHEFFRVAADGCEDAAGKEMFLSLAREEVEHRKLLEAEFKSLLENGRFLPHAEVMTRIPEEHTAIPVEAFRESLKRSHFEMSAISIGVTLEQNAIAHFKKMAEETDEEEARKTFSWLVEWERGHLDQLRELDQMMRDTYWADQGFTPM